jgi:hypothetical protein
MRLSGLASLQQRPRRGSSREEQGVASPSFVRAAGMHMARGQEVEGWPMSYALTWAKRDQRWKEKDASCLGPR